MSTSQHLESLIEYVKQDRELVYTALATDRGLSPGHVARLRSRAHKLTQIIEALWEYQELQH